MSTLTLIHGHRRSLTEVEQAAESVAVCFKVFALHVAGCTRCCASALSPKAGPFDDGVTLCAVGWKCVESWRAAHSAFWNQYLLGLTSKGSPHVQ